MGVLLLLLLAVLRALWWCLRLPFRAVAALGALVLLADAGEDEQGASGRRDWFGAHRPQQPMQSGRFWAGEPGPRWWRRRF